MVRKKVRNRFLVFKNKQTSSQTNKQLNNHYEAKYTNIQTNMARQKVRTQFLLLKKKSRGKEKSKNSILTIQKKKNPKRKVRT